MLIGVTRCGIGRAYWCSEKEKKHPLCFSCDLPLGGKV